MDIGNLLNDSGQSPTLKPQSLPDTRSMTDVKPRPDVAPERHSLPSDMPASAQQHSSAPTSASYTPHQQYGSQYSIPQMQPYSQLPPGYTSYPPQNQTLNGLPSPTKAEGSIASPSSDPRALPGTRQGSEGDVKDTSMPKNFTCGTPSCGKAFARRSDLVRHERIHSGVRPHKCPWPYCTKQFIQRSALTVHERVHSGEKPHMCGQCGKNFSDSSSLARHRRIHSGKRPYKCPFPDCQKTFTRRTTLTRHQGNHTNTIHEASAAHAAALASHASHASVDNSERADGDSETGSTPDGHQQQHQHQQQQQQPQPQQQQPQHQQQGQYPSGHGPPQGYYAPALPALGQAPASSTPASRAQPVTGSYRPPGPGSSFEQPVSQTLEHSSNPQHGVASTHQGYQSYGDHRYAPPSYQPAYYQPQHLRHASNHDSAYDPHGQLGVTWTQSMS